MCVTLPILRGLDGKRRMGKILGNYIGVGMSAEDQFTLTMSMPDEPMKEWFTLLTDRPAAEIEALTDAIEPARGDGVVAELWGDAVFINAETETSGAEAAETVVAGVGERAPPPR